MIVDCNRPSSDFKSNSQYNRSRMGIFDYNYPNFRGLQLVALGIIGEYIARIHDQVKNRPLYVIEGVYANNSRAVDTH